MNGPSKEANRVEEKRINCLAPAIRDLQNPIFKFEDTLRRRKAPLLQKKDD